MCNDNLAPDVQTLEFALQRRNHYPADKYCGKQSVIRWIEIYGIDSNIHCDPFNSWALAPLVSEKIVLKYCWQFPLLMNPAVLAVLFFDFLLFVSPMLCCEYNVC